MRRARLPACFVCGYALFLLAGGEIITNRIDTRYEGDSMLVVARVADFPKPSGNAVVMRVEPLDDARVSGLLHISWFEPPVIPRLGEVWELELRLRRPHGRLNPGGFDYETWLFREKVHASGYVVNGQRNRLLWAGGEAPLDRFRSRFIERTRAAVPDPETAAVLAAIGVGARHDVTRAQWERFAATGTTHLMAISGLHVGLAALIGIALAFPLAAIVNASGNHYVVAVIAGVATAAGYALVSGWGVPARRAVVMLLLGMLAVTGRRQFLPTTVIAIAAAVVFVADPIASLSPGFHLSFAAVALLLWLSRRTTGTRGRTVAALLRLVRLQVFLAFGLAPLTTVIFQRIAILSVPVNLVAVPLFSILTVPLTVAALVIGDGWEPGARTLLRLAAGTVDVVDAVARTVAAWPVAQVRVATLEGIGWLFLALPAAWVLLPRSWPGRRAAVIGLVALLAWKPPPPPAACFDAWVLDVGQGLAVVIQTPSGAVLYDTGLRWRDGNSVATHTILPFLRARGIDRVSHLVVSHADLDHSGGARDLLDGLDVNHTIAGEPLPGIAARDCRRGLTWRSGAVQFAVLHPVASVPVAGNDASCVVRVSVGDTGMLLTGDIERRGERDLLRRGELLANDAVLVPHHGSLTSSSRAFVEALQARVAVVSTGYRNRWGFPRPGVVDRWEESGARVLNTATDGALRLRLCARRGIVDVRAEREQRRRFWHAATH